MTTTLRAPDAQRRTSSARSTIPWSTVLPLAVAMAYVSGFWIISMRGSVGAIERTQTPFASWWRGSTLGAATVRGRGPGRPHTGAPLVRSGASRPEGLPLDGSAGRGARHGRRHCSAGCQLGIRLPPAGATGRLETCGGRILRGRLPGPPAAGDPVPPDPRRRHRCRAAPRLQPRRRRLDVGVPGWSAGDRLDATPVSHGAAARRTSACSVPHSSPALWCMLPSRRGSWPTGVRRERSSRRSPRRSSSWVSWSCVSPVRLVSWCAVAISLGPLLIWACSRTVGLPFGPDTPEGVGLAGVAAGVLELAALLCAAALLRAQPTTRGPSEVVPPGGDRLRGDRGRCSLRAGRERAGGLQRLRPARRPVDERVQRSAAGLTGP